jgi:hypothetical protein
MNRLEKLKSKYPGYHYKNVSKHHKFAKSKKQTKKNTFLFNNVADSLDNNINKLIKLL